MTRKIKVATAAAMAIILSLSAIIAIMAMTAAEEKRVMERSIEGLKESLELSEREGDLLFLEIKNLQKVIGVLKDNISMLREEFDLVEIAAGSEEPAPSAMDIVLTDNTFSVSLDAGEMAEHFLPEEAKVAETIDDLVEIVESAQTTGNPWFGVVRYVPKGIYICLVTGDLAPYHVTLRGDVPFIVADERLPGKGMTIGEGAVVIQSQKEKRIFELVTGIKYSEFKSKVKVEGGLLLPRPTPEQVRATWDRLVAEEGAHCGDPPSAPVLPPITGERSKVEINPPVR